MKNKKNTDYSFSFESSKSSKIIFETLKDVRFWWSGLFGEEIDGKSKELNDSFTFKAGGGLHYSKQKLIESVPSKKIIWKVTESNLTFLKKQDEWTNTKFGFEIVTHENLSKVTFTHQGLIPNIECYDSCSDAWTNYLQNLAKKLV
jgi:hypothetical protein